jgi:hypothetical protein
VTFSTTSTRAAHRSNFSRSEAFDQPLLETCSDFRQLLQAGIESVEIKNGRTVRTDQASMEKLYLLSRVAYAKRKVRLAGRLYIIRYSDCRFTLLLENDVKVAGTALGLGPEALRDSFGKNVERRGLTYNLYL